MIIASKPCKVVAILVIYVLLLPITLPLAACMLAWATAADMADSIIYWLADEQEK